MLVTLNIDDEKLQVRVLRAFAARLGAGCTRVDFGDVAKELQTSRQAVAYNVKKLVHAGVLRSHGKDGFSLADRAEG